MNWIVETLLIHVLFLGSIFVIYFRSPVIQGLSAQSDLVNPPAKRLVLFVTDGLRADSFFEEGCKHVPHIKNIILKKGMIGISHTRVPTESRPGHIALIAGLYEDPTAVTKGWQENPIDFDSLFNRSRKTYAWGSNDVLSIFSKADYNKKMEFYAYDHSLDFSGIQNSYQLDTWVFTRARDYVIQNAASLKSESRVVFFLHLLGLDTAGHVHKPGSPLFLENLRVTENGIAEMYYLFEKLFGDQETAYVLTSDHGMTDTGSHGAGATFETDTPLFVWGAGVNNWNSLPKNVYSRLKAARIADTIMPSFDIEQADIAPLMAALIGTAVPINNYGKLPKHLLNVPEDYLAKALLNNALQTLAQFEKLFIEFKKGLFSHFLPSFAKLNENTITEFKATVRRNIQEGNYEQAMGKSEEFIDSAIEGIEYYQMYYRGVLLVCTTLAFFGWICNLLIMLDNSPGSCSFRKSRVLTISAVITIVIVVFIIVQKVPLIVGVYFMLPLYCWTRVIIKVNVTSMKKLFINNWKLLLGMAIGSELLVLTFFKRGVVSVAFLAFVLYQNSTFKVLREVGYAKYLYYEWMITALLLSTFPFIPLGYLKKNDFYLMFGGLLLMAKLSLSIKNLKHSMFLQIICFIGFANCTFCLYLQNTRIGLFTINTALSWILSGFSLIAPITSDANVKYRNASIFFYFTVPFLHLSIGYEMIFFTLMGTHILDFVDLSVLLDHQSITMDAHNNRENIRSGNLLANLNISAAMLLMIFVSFFGTGNMASISSFDPIFVRFFVTIFSPFIMSALIVLKLVIPILLITSSITALTHRRRMDEKKVFLSLLLICEIMGLNFLFLVTNKGSWLEIGTSISHFVIMEVTTLVLAIVNYLTKFLLFMNFTKTLHTTKSGKSI